MLGGWQRLWVLIGVLWTIGVVWVGAGAWPTPSSVTLPELNRQLAASQIAKSGTESDAEARKAALQAFVQKMIDTGATEAQMADAIRSATGTPPPTVLGFDPDSGRAIIGMDESGKWRYLDQQRWDAASSKALMSRRLSFLYKAIAAWFAPLVVLFSLGWSIGWIRRGFQSPNAPA